MVPAKTSLLITTDNLDHGGVEEVIFNYAKLLDKEAFDVTVACLRPGTISAKIAAVPGVRLVHIATKSRILRLVRFAALARAVKADIVHNHACWYGHLAGTLSGAKNVETIHNMFSWFTWFERWHYGLYSLLAQTMIAVSDHVRRYTLDHIPLMNPSKLVVVRNGIPVERFRDVKADEELRRRHGIASGAPVIGFVGRLTFQKGVEHLIDAAALLAATHPEARILIVGEGDLWDDLQTRAADRPQVIFAGYQQEIPRYLAMFDVFILPSQFEGLPMSVLEAMAAGKPVVATAVGGTPEVVVDGVTGFLVEPKRADQLAERLSRLIGDPELRLRMGAAGRARVMSHFSAEGMVRATEAIYADLVAGRRRRAGQRTPG